MKIEVLNKVPSHVDPVCSELPGASCTEAAAHKAVVKAIFHAHIQMYKKPNERENMWFSMHI